MVEEARGRRVFARYRGMITAFVALAVLGGCAGTSQVDVEKARQEGAQTQAQSEASKRQQEAQQSLAAEVQRLKEEAAKTATPPPAPAAPQGTAPAAAATTSCGANLSVNANTSCSFADNVQADFYRAGGGNVTLNVYSPVTGQYYRMTCQSGIPTVCRGGNNAVVYIR